MGDKLPQPTAVVIRRLRRLGRALRKESECFHTSKNKARFLAWANTCDQASGRLEDYINAHGGDVRLPPLE